jgi:hypothetical protein
MKMEQTECSETSAYKIQMPGNYPKKIYNVKNMAKIFKYKTIYITNFSRNSYSSSVKPGLL